MERVKIDRTELDNTQLSKLVTEYKKHGSLVLVAGKKLSTQIENRIGWYTTGTRNTNGHILVNFC